MQLVVPSAVRAAVAAAMKMRRRTSHTEFFFIAIWFWLILVSILSRRAFLLSLLFSRRAAEFAEVTQRLCYSWGVYGVLGFL